MTRPSKWIVIALFAALAIGVAACSLIETPAGITQVVMAQSTQGTNFEPVNIGDSYAPDAPEFHAVVTLANAPKDTLVKAVWVAVDVGNAAPPDSKIDETEVKTEGSRNVDFSLQRGAAKWPAGLYKVQIYYNSKLDRTLNFVVTGTPVKVGTPAGACPAATTQAHKVSGWIAQVIMTAKVDGNNEATDRTGEFLVNDVVYAVVAIKNAPANTKFRAVFYAVDAGGSTICNVKLSEAGQIADGSRNLAFSLKPDSPWALGTYRIDIYVNDALDHTANYVVVPQRSVH